MFQYLDGDVRGTQHTPVLQVGEFLPFLFTERVLVIGKVYETGEESRVCSRHLLTGNDDGRIHTGLLSLLILIHIHAHTAYASPDIFQELELLNIDAVLVFVKMHQGIADGCNGIGQRRDG